MAKNRVLVVAVHPDDETIGGGGTLLKHSANGDTIACLFITSGNAFQETTIPQLNKLYGLDECYVLNLPEIILDDISLSEIIPKISNVFQEYKPTTVYLPNRSDPHSDHRKAFEACQACIKSFRYPYIEKVMMMEVISETDFAPTLPETTFIPHVFVDISDFFEQKMAILKIFESELLESPYTRSMDTMSAYNRYRGSQINAVYAECFMLLKEIVR